MVDEARLEASVEAHESYEQFPYKDKLNRWTWADGDCLETSPPTGEEWKYLLDNALVALSITKPGAQWLMRRRLDAVSRRLAIDFEFWLRLNDAQQNALSELAFQIGVAGEEGFHDMIAAIRVALHTGDWAPVKAAGLDSDWARETPARAEIILDQLCTGQVAAVG